MGIFDDAIRQHLDLKRRQGADEGELQQLEDEAFGLPARPGDPDFTETGESAIDGESAPESPPTQPEPDQPAAPPEQEEAQPVAEEAKPAAEASEEPAPHGDALLADSEAEPAPPPADEGPIVDEGAAGFTTTERAAISDKPTEFFDEAPEPLDLGDLDLDLKDELDEVGTIEDEPLTAEEGVEEPAPVDEGPAVDAATPVDELEIVEETEPASETELPIESEELSDAEEAQAEPAEDEAGDESEDVLEETPEFLRDNPDDDELWFEQGEPKDFDF